MRSSDNKEIAWNEEDEEEKVLHVYDGLITVVDFCNDRCYRAKAKHYESIGCQSRDVSKENNPSFEIQLESLGIFSVKGRGVLSP